MEFSHRLCDSRERPRKNKPTYNIFNLKSKGFSVNKSELIDAIAESSDISKAAAGRALDAMTSSITGALKNVFAHDVIKESKQRTRALKQKIGRIHCLRRAGVQQ